MMAALKSSAGTFRLGLTQHESAHQPLPREPLKRSCTLQLERILDELRESENAQEMLRHHPVQQRGSM